MFALSPSPNLAPCKLNNKSTLLEVCVRESVDSVFLVPLTQFAGEAHVSFTHTHTHTHIKGYVWIKQLITLEQIYSRFLQFHMTDLSLSLSVGNHSVSSADSVCGKQERNGGMDRGAEECSEQRTLRGEILRLMGSCRDMYYSAVSIYLRLYHGFE